MGEHRESTLSFLIADDFLNPPCCSECTSVSKSMGDICLCGAYNFNCLRGVEEKSNAVLKTGYLREWTCSLLPTCCDAFSTTSPAPWSKLYRRDFLIAHNHYFQDSVIQTTFFSTFLHLLLRQNSVCAGVFDSLSSCQTGKLANSDRIKNPEDFCVALRASFRYLEDEGYLPPSKKLSLIWRPIS